MSEIGNKKMCILLLRLIKIAFVLPKVYCYFLDTTEIADLQTTDGTETSSIQTTETTSDNSGLCYLYIH